MPDTETRMPGLYLMGTRPVAWKPSCLWQARMWIGQDHGGAVSLGLHRTMQTAHQYWSDVRRLYFQRKKRTSAHLALLAWECARQAWPRGESCPLLPKWVYRIKSEAGVRYGARARIGDHAISIEPVDDPRQAFLRLWELLPN